jgi:hypothetical protein
MKILALERSVPGVADEAFTATLLEREARALWDLQQRGLVREAWFRAEVHETVLVLECASADEAIVDSATSDAVARAPVLSRFRGDGIRRDAGCTPR